MFHIVVLFSIAIASAVATWSTLMQPFRKKDDMISGVEAIERANNHLDNEEYDEAAEFYWHAIMKVDKQTAYSANDVFQLFMKCYSSRGIIEEGYIAVAQQYLFHRQIPQALQYLDAALEMNPKAIKAHLLWVNYADGSPQGRDGKEKHIFQALQVDPKNVEANILAGNHYWDKKDLAMSLKHFEVAFNSSQQSTEPHYQALCNAIYLRESPAITV